MMFLNLLPIQICCIGLVSLIILSFLASINDQTSKKPLKVQFFETQLFLPWDVICLRYFNETYQTRGSVLSGYQNTKKWVEKRDAAKFYF